MTVAQPILLSVNINKIALIRNSRDTDYPNIVTYAKHCITAGADGITVHPRPDQRHIRADDCFALNDALAVEFNIEGNPFAGAYKSTRANVADYPGFMPLVRAVKPTQCTLVPDHEQQLTSDHGFDLRVSAHQLAPIITELKSLGIRVSLFMDPDPMQMELAKQIGADRVELYTGPYAAAVEQCHQVDAVFERYYCAAQRAFELGLGLNAGHDLNLHNLTKFASIPHLREVSIGHFLTIDALNIGLKEAIRAYQHCLGKYV